MAYFRLSDDEASTNLKFPKPSDFPSAKNWEEVHKINFSDSIRYGKVRYRTLSTEPISHWYLVHQP
jgi:hypothetical protein